MLVCFLHSYMSLDRDKIIMKYQKTLKLGRNEYKKWGTAMETWSTSNKNTEIPCRGMTTSTKYLHTFKLV